MDIVTDLTAEAVSYITVMQDICRQKIDYNITKVPSGHLWDIVTDKLLYDSCRNKMIDRVREIVWADQNLPDEILCRQFTAISIPLLQWLKVNLNPQHNIMGLHTSPFLWRSAVRTVLYQKPEQRLTLVEILQYVPLQIILALSTKRPSLYKQRLLQVYISDNPAYEKCTILSEGGATIHMKWWEKQIPGRGRRILALEYLVNDDELLRNLKKNEVALPFETLFGKELDELTESRGHRKLQKQADWRWRVTDTNSSRLADPIARAQQMNLTGLAFSGGGIRSATFNLGILQKLATLGALPSFDYISTVSGGGYIGSWFTSWIKRAGSISKVSNRLNPGKSGDPLAEEVRPVRWLRMFSNYLSPRASIMSVDAWTMGITWLRNTIINQGILLLALLTVLACITAIFEWWLPVDILNEEITFRQNHSWWISLLIIPACLFAGLGMGTFDHKLPMQKAVMLGKHRYLPHLLSAWTIVSSFTLCTLFVLEKGSDDFKTIACKFDFLCWPCITAGMVGMLLIALMGNYHLYPGRYSKDKDFLHHVKLYTAIIISSFIATLAGTYLLAAAWQFLVFLAGYPFFSPDSYPTENLHQKLQLIIGVPLIVEVFGITVVLRMMLLGSMFTDDRREWWGRLGAMIHRFIFYWLLITIAALLLPGFFKKTSEWLLPTVGGWSAIIGWALKLAYSKATKEENNNGSGFNIREIFVRVAPYLFMLGFLLIGAYTLNKIYYLFFGVPRSGVSAKWFVLSLILGAATLFISWRVGVNEFSLHHFYKNRLVRAYLGATRRRRDRESTANTFTGFDNQDDIPLAKFCTTEQYYGPMPLINTTLNASTVSDLDRQDRKAESFLFSPLYCGYDFSPTRSSSFSRNQVYEYGYRPTADFSKPGGPLMGTAMAISGAAVNPNMGYHSSQATAFLLTIFNLRLGWWLGNTRLSRWKRSDPRAGLIYLFYDLIGKTNINTDYVCLSDGGHFDNMGLYELIRRKCAYILLCDAEEDQKSTCEGLANAIRRCRIDMGVEINIDVSDILLKDETTGYCKSHIAQGTIKYPGDIGPLGKLVYIKTSLTGNESSDLKEYFKNNPFFPQQSTGDQFFDEQQFESYRKLGFDSFNSLSEIE